jgi:hypothetical protein
MLPLIVVLAIAATPAHGAGDCALTRLSECQNTNQLVWDRAFHGAVRRFVGRRRANFIFRGWAADQLIDVLGGPPDPPHRIGALYRFTACWAQECEDKGAAVLEPDGQIVALGILHSDCIAAGASSDCFAHDTLTVFVRNRAGQEAVDDDLTTWAKSLIAQSYTAPRMPAEHLDKVEFIKVGPA